MTQVSRVIWVLVAVFASELAVQSPACVQAHWPRFRGPDGAGHYRQNNLPVSWNADDISWRIEPTGQGYSSACIWDQLVFLTTARKTDSDQVERTVLCLDRADGHLVWQQVASVGEGEPLHAMNGFATPTCASDGERVVAFFGRGGIHCYDMQGQLIWSRDLGNFPGQWGTAASPVIVNDMVIQNCDAEGESFLVALDKRTGKTLWRTDRGTRPRGGWATPFVIDTKTRRELILNGEFGVRGYNPATGEEHWFCKSFNGRGTPTPACGHGLLFVISGKRGDIYAVRPGGEKDVTATHMIWHTPRRGGRDLSSPILLENRLFTVSMNGVATCYDASTGEQLWLDRLDGKFSASPIAANGLVYIQNEAGETTVIKLADELDVVAKNDPGAAEGEIFRSTLSASEGQLFFRSDRAAYCVGKRDAR